MIGRTLNQFQITAKIGQGGMGEVYRAAHGQGSIKVPVKRSCDRQGAPTRTSITGRRLHVALPEGRGSV